MKKKNKALVAANATLATKLEYAVREAERARSDSNKWRTAYEQVTSSPEIKADTEGAFKRGVAHARKSMAAYLVTELEKVQIEE